jgi:hypothetical protein
MKHASDSTFSRRNPSQRTRRTLAAAIALSAALAFSGVAVAEQCNQVRGQIHPLVPCSSGVPGCFVGSFTGDLTGTVQSQLTGFQQLPGHSDSIIFTATSLITVEGRGTITTTDVGVGTLCTGPGGPCASSNEILTITSGTGAYDKAFGTVFLTGAYMNSGLGQYQGQICTGKPKRDKD